MSDTLQIGLVELLMIGGSCAAWWWLIGGWRRGRPAVKIELTREPPWDVADVLFVLAIYVVTNIVAAHWLLDGSESEGFGATSVEVVASESEEQGGATKPTSEHPVIQLLYHADNAKILLLAFFVVAIAAPLWEEFLFRLMLLGWLAKLERRLRRRVRARWPYGLGALLVTSVLFAMMHFRADGKPMDVGKLVAALQVTGIANCASLAISVVFLRARHQVSCAQLGFSSMRFGYDLRVAAVGFFAIAIPLLFLQYSLKLLLPSGFAPDPIPLFVLAIVFGYLYLRTGRITSCVLLHIALNTFSLLSALAFIYMQNNLPK